MVCDVDVFGGVWVCGLFGLFCYCDVVVVMVVVVVFDVRYLVCCCCFEYVSGVVGKGE